MTLYGIFSSPRQMKRFLLTSSTVILLSICCIFFIYFFTPDTRGWNLVLDVFAGLLASAIFVIVASLYLKNFFEDPYETALATKLLPRDIGPALSEMADNATEYKLFVRTGRYFRAAILPLLVNAATKSRKRVTIDAILLDFRRDSLCERYALYRASSSFDQSKWSTEYVQKEILATILKLIQAASKHPSFLRVNLYLSNRLSTFRIDGSQDQIVVTREDPKDYSFAVSKF